MNISNFPKLNRTKLSSDLCPYSISVSFKMFVKNCRSVAFRGSEGLFFFTHEEVTQSKHSNLAESQTCLYVFGVGVSCRKLYSFVVYLYVNGSGSITSVGEERANLSAVVYL